MSVAALRTYVDECVAALNAVSLEAVEAVSEALLSARRDGRWVFIAGNGGSASTASHMATDLMLGSQLLDPPLIVIALADNQEIITATGKNLDFEQIFARQVSMLARPGDLLIKVSASDNSANILACVHVVRAMKLTTIGFTGFDGGKLAEMVDLLIHVPTRIGAYGAFEDVHLAANHMITELLKG